jgi:hypothetical protein
LNSGGPFNFAPGCTARNCLLFSYSIKDSFFAIKLNPRWLGDHYFLCQVKHGSSLWSEEEKKSQSKEKKNRDPNSKQRNH